jgi:hypothetical protein
MSFEHDGYAIIRGALSGVGLDIVQKAMKHSFIEQRANPSWVMGDGQVDKRWKGRRDSLTESILMGLLPLVAQEVGQELVPSYSYPVTYIPGAILHKHIDRFACEVTCTMTLANEPETTWPIFMNNPMLGRTHEIRVDLEPGDLLIYHGSKFPHWRDAQEENHFNMSIFLHYIYANGLLLTQREALSPFHANVTLLDIAKGYVAG